MKKIIFPICFLSIFSMYGYAQSDINFGIKGGLNYCSFSGTTKWTSQYAIGGLIEFQIGSISIQPEILYSIKGNKSNETIYVAGIAKDVVFTEALTYIDIPLLLKIHLHSPLEKFSLLIGPSFGFLINANQHIEGSGIVGDNDNKSDYVNKDWGIVLGAGIDVPLDVINLTIDARYDFGLRTFDPSGHLGVYNRVVSLYIGIVF